ncbi:MAG: ABC transporter substrate-binding protein [Ferroplasma sp.]|uniref:ABC transporter substrate-binding protein n=1 Tax=Ferroplasma sp. TaxID=2591003 RepID=UPI00281553E4|nr:ABC transporter substrate-binding protein [Ferroplasma sp.]WMT51437.1 MAG: ABC transporter substrate-binding protein [Ferroplasma sp.]
MTSSMPDPETYPKKPRSTRKKWYAIIIVLMVVLSSFAILSLLHPSRLEPSIKVDSAQNYISPGENYTLTLKSNEAYRNITVEWGDNTETAMNYTGNTLSISHIYTSPGIYYIYYWANFSSGLYRSNTYIPVYVENQASSNRTAEGIITVLNSSIPSVVSNSNIYRPGTALNISIGNTGCPVNSTFKIISQSLTIYHNGTMEQNKSGYSTYSLNLGSGYYILKLITITGHGTANYKSTYYMDIPVNPNAILYINTVADSIVVDSLNPYSNLNPQEAYTAGDLEILYNTEQFLVGNGTSGYFPEVASSLPGPDGNSYTFHISHNVRFQNGIPVNAYDVYYSLVMDLLLEDKSPQTPGWILAQYLLPGNYHETNNYTNIMNAITYSNSTDTVTLNFTVHLSPSRVYGLLSSPGTFISSATNLSRNGEDISFTPAGFHAFKSANSNYTMENILADGPYEIEKSVPGKYITLIRNPEFTGTANNTAPSMDTVTIDYRNSYSAIYQDMRFNTSQIGVFPSSYTYLSGLASLSTYNITYNLSSIYNFNANINTTLLERFVPDANMPYNLFSNITVREAFYEAYPGNNLSMAKSLWRSFITNSTESSKYHIASNLYYSGSPLVIPLFTEAGISGSNISEFSKNLAAMVSNGSSFPIINEPVAFMNTYISAGINPMPVYEETLPEMNSSIYYSYLGSTENFTHSYANGFSYYAFNISNKNQSVLMKALNSNISSLVQNYNNTNLKNVKTLMNSTHMYILPIHRRVEMKIYYQSYLTMKNSITGSGIMLFNDIVA